MEQTINDGQTENIQQDFSANQVDDLISRIIDEELCETVKIVFLGNSWTTNS